MRGAVWPLVGAAEMRALDRHTIETLAVPGEILMESAGRAVVEEALRLRGGLAVDAEVCVVCGPGNNGGDGLVVARHLMHLGVGVRVALLADGARLAGDVAAQHRRATAVGVPISEGALELPTSALIVDAIFGTGLARPVEGAFAVAIARMNEARDAGSRIVAVDLPSGLDADTGQPLGTAVDADSTVTFALPKLGLALEPGRSLAGRVRVARIGIADHAPDAVPRAAVWTRAAAGAALPARPRHGHKGTFGHVLVVAGSEGKTGAAALAALGAARAGAGLVTIACPAGLNDVLEVKCTEAMTAPVADTAQRGLAAGAEDAILALAAERDAVGVGPGLGRQEETIQLMRSLAKRLEAPLAIDADGLLAFADEPEALAARPAATVLTPHPGEAARLLGCDPRSVNADRPGAARRLAELTGAVVCLKGAATVVAEPSGRLLVNPTGGPALATGGTGDVLTGLVTAYLAQGAPPAEAAALAAYVHGYAADCIARETGPSGMLASDLADAVPAAAESLRRAAAAARDPLLGLAPVFPENAREGEGEDGRHCR